MHWRPSESVKPDTKDRLKLTWEAFAYLRRPSLDKIYGEHGQLQLDLEGFDILSHDGLLWILSIIRWRTSRSIGSTIVHLPHDKRQLHFLKELRFTDHVLRAGGGFANEYVLWNRSTEESPSTSSLFLGSLGPPTKV